MSIKRAGVDHAIFDRGNRGADALHVDLGVAFVGIDDVETAPVPELHVHLAWSILMESGDDEPPAFSRQFACKIERVLLADRLDDTITQKAPGSFFDGSDDSITIIHWKSFGGSHPARDIAREGSSRHGDDPCSRRVRKPSQQCPEKADSDDGNRVPCCDLAAAKDVHCTAERLAG